MLAAERQFCVLFGCETKVGSKRKQTGNVKIFKHPFRADKYMQYLNDQHPLKWNEYQQLSEEGKKIFPITHQIHTSWLLRNTPNRIEFFVSKSIVEVLIGDMFCSPDPEDNMQMTKERMMQVFESCVDATEEEGQGYGDSHYSITIKNCIQCQLAIDYLAASLFFRQAVAVIQSTKERIGLASIGSCTDKITAKYAQFSRAINLQKLSNLLQRCWAFSVAMDMSTHMTTGYLDIRV